MTPDRSAPVLRVTSTALTYQPLADPAGLPATGAAAAEVFGAVRSMLTGELSAPLTLPALSLTEALSTRPSPSPATGALAGASPSRPESASPAVQAT